MLVLGVERRPFAHPVERDQHAARRVPGSRAATTTADGALAGDAVEPVPDARGEVGDVLARCRWRRRVPAIEEAAAIAVPTMSRLTSPAAASTRSIVVILEQHQEGAGLGHGPPAL